MKKNNRFERGQALVLITFAMLGLIGITGLAVDGSMAFSDRRHAQNAADTAAISGALGKMQPVTDPVSGNLLTPDQSMQYLAHQRAESNGYNGDLIHNEVDVYSPPISGVYSDCTSYSFDCNDYVQVIIKTNVPTFFARVLGIPQVHNQVQAVALASHHDPGPLYGGNAIVELKPTSSNCSGDFVFGGSNSTEPNPKLVLDGGGIYINSDGACALVQGGCNAYIDLQNGATISLVGGEQAIDSCTDNIPTPTHVTTQYPIPPEWLPKPPPECNITPQAPQDLGGNTYRLFPGYYDKMPPQVNATFILDPGNYCVGNVVKGVVQDNNISGDGVFIYIKPGGYFDFGSNGSVNLSAPTSGDYQNLLIYVAPDITNLYDMSEWFSPAPNCSITGHSGDTFQGTIYAPHCDVSIVGTSSSTGLHIQVIAWEVKISGTATLYFTYNPDEQVIDPGYSKTGLAR